MYRYWFCELLATSSLFDCFLVALLRSRCFFLFFSTVPFCFIITCLLTANLKKLRKREILFCFSLFVAYGLWFFVHNTQYTIKIHTRNLLVHKLNTGKCIHHILVWVWSKQKKNIHLSQTHYSVIISTFSHV